MAGRTELTMHRAVSNGSYDVAKIRADFPALAMQVYGKPLVYLDNAASAQKPKQVLDRLQKGSTISQTRRPRPTKARARRCAHF